MLNLFRLKSGNRLDRKDTFFQYSTEEQFTGKYWIDGKKIYSKVIAINQTHDGHNDLTITHNIGIDYIIRYYGTGYVANQVGYRRCFPYTSCSDSTGFYMTEYHENTIKFWSNWRVDGYVVIEYTKIS